MKETSGQWILRRVEERRGERREKEKKANEGVKFWKHLVGYQVDSIELYKDMIKI